VEEGEDEDENNNEELTPPPDTPADELLSDTSSPQALELADEIVVGSNANRTKSSPHGDHSDQEDIDMDDVEADADPDLEHARELDSGRPAPPLSSKRKRGSTQSEASEERTALPVVATVIQPPARRPVGRPPTKIQKEPNVKGIILGHWRESPVQDIKDRHAVIGFMDARDRLRTRVQTMTRDGRNIGHLHPIPPGPGGSWVTFDKISFDDHLVNLNHHQVKEFVKIRTVKYSRDEAPEVKARLDEIAVKEAIRRVEENPPAETNQPVLVAYGITVPEHAILPARADKRRKYNSLGASGLDTPATANVMDNIPGTRPTRILLGYWKLSSEDNVEDKHAVYGILGANDMFRVKLMRETRDGRPMLGNFPLGPGALWIHWDEVEFEPHLKTLQRAEIKEYCRVRQRQLDDGESSEERVVNETKAVTDAQTRVANFNNMPSLSKGDMSGLQPLAAKKESTVNGNGPDDDFIMAGHYGSASNSDMRPSRRENGTRGRHSFPDLELGVASRPQSVDIERTNSIARREVARVEAAQERANQRAAIRDAQQQQPGAGGNNRAMFQDSISRLNRVWASQETNRLKGGAEDAKIYMGVKYERKQNGPFEGRFVSQGTIISIDGEDYVEYRVLTKPSFF
jgi:hypothetical protein